MRRGGFFFFGCFSGPFFVGGGGVPPCSGPEGDLEDPTLFRPKDVPPPVTPGDAGLFPDDLPLSGSRWDGGLLSIKRLGQCEIGPRCSLVIDDSPPSGELTHRLRLAGGF